MSRHTHHGFNMIRQRSGRGWKWTLTDTLGIYLDSGHAPTEHKALIACRKAKKPWKEKFEYLNKMA